MRWDGSAMLWCMIRPMRPLHSIVTNEKFSGIKRLSLSMQLFGCYTFLSYAYSRLVYLQKNAMLIHCPNWHSRITIRPVSNGHNGPLNTFPKSEYGFASSTGACRGKCGSQNSKWSVVGVKARNTPTTLKEHPSKLWMQRHLADLRNPIAFLQYWGITIAKVAHP